MTSKEEILEIIRYTNSLKNNLPLFTSQCDFLEKLLTNPNSFEDPTSKLLIEETLSEHAELIYSTEKLVDIRFQYAISLLYKTSNYTECLKILTNLLLISSIEHHHNYLQILLEMGSVHSILNKFDEAKYYFQKARMLSQSKSDESFRIVAKQANILLKKHKHSEAISVLEALLESFDSISPHNIAGVCLTLGTIYSKLLNTEQSLKYFQKAMLLRDISNFEFGVVLYNNLGNLHSRMNDFDQSVHYFEQSLHFAKKTEKIDLQIGSYVNLASIEIQRENYKEAQFLLENASQHIDKVPKSYITLRVNERLAYVYLQSGDEVLFEKAKVMIEHTISDSIHLQIDDLLASSYWVNSLYYKKKEQHSLQYENLLQSYTLSVNIKNLFMEYITSMELTEYFLYKKDVEAKTFLEKTQKAFSLLHNGYQESKIASMYVLNIEVALLENNIGDAKYYFNKLDSLPSHSKEPHLNEKILQIKSFLQI